MHVGARYPGQAFFLIQFQRSGTQTHLLTIGENFSALFISLWSGIMETVDDRAL